MHSNKQNRQPPRNVASTQDLAQPKQVKQPSSAGRINPQLSCTVTPEDKQLLDELTVFATVKHRKAVNVSSLSEACTVMGGQKMLWNLNENQQ